MTAMKKAIATELKVRIAALYYGQKIMQTTIKNNPSDLSGVMLVEPMAFIPPGSQYFLNVIPLSSITDEDAIEVAKSVYGNRLRRGYVCKCKRYADGCGLEVSLSGDFDCIMQINFNSCSFRLVTWAGSLMTMRNYGFPIDYLRSKGYALPALGCSVDELVETGVFKLK